jgi:hypothetical protein
VESLGAAESLGVAEPMASGSVGVGTGGIVSGGSGSSEASVAAADGILVGAVVAAADGGPADADARTEADTAGRADAGSEGLADDGAGLGCRAGASPIPPEPMGAAIAAERAAGVASCQPMVTATGRPSATSPIKMDLGDNRT